MKPEVARRLLACLAAILGVLALAAVLSSPMLSSAARVLPFAAQTDCGAISCTTLLPVILMNYPPPSNLEVTQAVQQPDNSVLLIENRPTFVRYTVTSTVAHTGVSAYLYGARDGVPLPGSPIAALNNPREIGATANQDALNDTFNFRLPPSWLSGKVTLDGFASNTTTFTATDGFEIIQYVQADPMNVTIVPVGYTCSSGGAGTSAPAPPYAYVTDFTYRSYPVASIPTSIHAAMVYSGPCLNNVPDPSGGDWENILSDVTSVWVSEGSPDDYYYALLTVECSAGCIAGIGWIVGYKAAAGFEGVGPAHWGAGETHAHEVGHNHGRYHAPGFPNCQAPVGTQDPSYPYATGYIGDSINPNHGFDIQSQAIYPFTTHLDIMGYCSPEWVSDYTYKALYDFDRLNRVVGSAVAHSQRALLVSGSIDPVGGRVTFRPAYAIDVAPRLPEHGDHTIELLDAAGRVVAAYAFTPVEAHADRWRAGSAFETVGFHMTLPYAEDVASIRVRRDGKILDTLDPGARTPSLRAGASALRADRRSVRVSWSAADADGERLRYLVRASTDGGATWQTIGVNLSTPAIDLNPIDFGSRRVLVEVLASDGLHTASLRLGPFAVREYR